MSLRSDEMNTYDFHDVGRFDVIVPNIRLKSVAGWYLGALEFYDFDDCNPYSRDSLYYQNEDYLNIEYPESISLDDAFYKVKHDRILSDKMNRKIKTYK